MLGRMHFDKVAEAPLFGLILSFHFGLPTLELVAVATMCSVTIVVTVESTGMGLALGEIFRTRLRDALLDMLDDLQARLDVWLIHYNQQRPHRGYRNTGRRPVEAFNQASATARHDE